MTCYIIDVREAIRIKFKNPLYEDNGNFKDEDDPFLLNYGANTESW